MTHQYEPLALPASEIRLAILEPGVHSDEICISFKNRALTDHAIEYEALSYAWGQVEDLSLARIDGRSVRPITQNLDDALRHLRFQDKPRVMWIDALCINQDDTTEKNQQVAVMGKIYSLATRVLMWLGPEADGSGEAFDLLEKLSREVQLDFTTLQMEPSSQCSSPDWADTTCILPFEAGELTSVHALYERPYFERAWIRQEIVLAKQATLHCGLRKMDWQDFRRSTLCLCQKPWDEDTALKKGTWRAFQDSLHGISTICLMRQHCFHIATLRYASRAADCHDDRDQIYSLMSLIGSHDGLLKITPDYNISAEHLYHDIAKRSVEIRQSLTFLESCHPASNNLELPSWVPDWSTRHPINGSQPQMSWSACAWISARARIEERILFAAGVSIARIETIQHFNVENEQNFYEITLDLIRKTRPSHWSGDLENQKKQTMLRNWSLALTGGLIDADFSVHKLMELLDLLWSTDTEWDELQKQFPGISPVLLFVGTCYHVLVKRCYFTATNGYAGLGLYDMQIGDVVCVILGCDYPVVLRPVHGTESASRWQVVGSAIVPGLMAGEAIYGGELPTKYQLIDPVVHGYQHRGTHDNIREGYNCAVYDTVNGVVVENPAVVLEDAGIKADRYQVNAFQLSVSPETLRNAGVALKEFALV